MLAEIPVIFVAVGPAVMLRPLPLVPEVAEAVVKVESGETTLTPFALLETTRKW
jgi:hypothetical protein